ncbi:MAG TPA: hypothetical protein VFU23_14050 [Gemmatimonadales bacterium]|nr:hypothetical protein [Gemmatimonadales bacterium]
MTTRLLALLAATGLSAQVSAQQPTVDPRLYDGLLWRNVGPFRGGRVAAVTGAIGQPGVFYAGYPGSGVWKTTSAGQTWIPVFDAIRSVSSVGAVEVAPSDPSVVYVGTGDMITAGTVERGDGVYKSSDAGRTWQHLGLDDTRHIPSIVVDPRSADLVLLAATGDPHQKSATRGIFRSADGGKSWSKVLYVDDETGGQNLARAYDVPDVVFATTVRYYVPADYPIEKLRSWQFGQVPRFKPDTGRTGTALYKSTDAGLTWHEVTGGGLPRLVGRTAVTVAMNTGAQRIFLMTGAGLYRSDDGGTTWRRMAADDDRIVGAGYMTGVWVDPRNPDIVYTVNTSSYKSVDGGKTFTGFKGAPGGDDPQVMWIDPTNPERIFLGLDQGATISLDGGSTWSSWYNQSTEQVYHIAADNSFPYWIYASQQDAGAIRTRSRGNYGAVTIFDWNSTNGWEWGTMLPDPLNPNLVYSSGIGIVKTFYPSEQHINVSPSIDPASKARITIELPIVWAPWNPRKLFAGFNYLTATTDAGAHWTTLSPELSIPAGLDSAASANTPGGRGAITAIAPSPVARGLIWVGTSNGLIHLTRNEGLSWTDVSIAGLPNPRRALVSGLDASPHNPGTAYAAIDYIRTGDHGPHLFRTRDYGKTWVPINTGLPVDEPSGSVTRVVRADPKKPGLLFAGTESGVHVSFDDGDHWQPLSLNLPNTSYRDLLIKGSDLIVGTYGRGIWILDDISVLRQLGPGLESASARLFAPGPAVRVRRNVNDDTPLPPEIPHALNPPDGAILYYWLGAKPAGDITLEILDSAGRVVRHLSSAPIPPVAEASHVPFPDYWLGHPSGLPVEVGTNRTSWDVRYDAPYVFRHDYAISANPGLTPPSPQGPLALPGTYTVRLTVDGKRYEQKLVVRNDPRSPATLIELKAQHALLRHLLDGINAAWDGQQQAVALRAAVDQAAPAGAAPELMSAATALRASIDSVAGPGGGRGGAGSGQTFQSVSATLVGQLTSQDNADHAPTAAMRAAYAAGCRNLAKVQASWRRVAGSGLAAFNAVLARHGVPAVAAPAPRPMCS